MNPSEYADQAKARLEQMTDDNQGRAKYQYEIRRAINLATDSINEYESTREAEMARVRQEFQIELDRAQAKLSNTLRELEEAKDALNGVPPHQFETSKSGNTIVFPAPTDENNRYRHWHVAELESLTYDLRLCGAVDHTPVEVLKEHTAAFVPFPEAIVMVQENRQDWQQKPTTPLTGDDPRAGDEIKPLLSSGSSSSGLHFGVSLALATLFFALSAALSIALLR